MLSWLGHTVSYSIWTIYVKRLFRYFWFDTKVWGLRLHTKTAVRLGGVVVRISP